VTAGNEREVTGKNLVANGYILKFSDVLSCSTANLRLRIFLMLESGLIPIAITGQRTSHKSARGIVRESSQIMIH